MPQIQQSEAKEPAMIIKSPPPVGTTGGDKSQDKLTSARVAIDNQMMKVRQTTNPTERLAEIGILSQMTRVYAADTKKDITKRVIASSPLPDIQAKLEEQRKGGIGVIAGNLLNAKLGMPNGETQLRQAQSTEAALAAKKIDEEFESNPDIASIQALHDPHGFLAVQARIALDEEASTRHDKIRDVNRADTVADQKTATAEREKSQIFQTKLSKQLSAENTAASIQLASAERKAVAAEERVRKQEELAAAITPEQRRVARIYGQKAEGDPSTDMFLLKNMEINKDFKDVVRVADSPDAMVSLALAGNPAAQTVAAHSQAEAISGTTDRTSPKYRAAHATATQDLKAMNRIMTSPDAYEQALTKVYGPKGSALRKKYDTNLANEGALVSSKDKLEMSKLKRAEVAKEALMSINKDRFLGSINSWPEQTLAFVQASPIFTKLAEHKGKDNVSVRDMTTEIMAIADPAERQRQMTAFKDAMQQAANVQNQAYFGFAIDNLEVDNTLSRQVTSTLAGDLSNPIGVGVAALRGIFNSYNPTKAVRDAYEALDKNTDIIRYIKGD